MVAFLAPWPEPLRDMAVNRQSRPLTQGMVKEGERNDTLFKQACSLRGAGQSEYEILDAIRTVNENRCLPPLSEKEVEAIVQSASKYSPGSPSPFSLFSFSPLRGGEKEKAILYEPLTIYQLHQQTEDVQWLIEGILPKGGVLILTGIPGIGKSWLLMDMVLAFEQGRKWLGHFDTVQASVIVIDEENAPPLLKGRLTKMGAMGTPEESQMSPRYLVMKGVLLDGQAQLDGLVEMLDRFTPDVVLLDSLIRLHTGSENDSQDMGSLNRTLSDLNRRYGCAFVVNHHRRKPGHQGGSDSHGYRGSSELQAYPDTHLDLGEQRGSLVLSASKSRYQQAMEPCVVEIVDIEDRTEVRYVGPVRDSQAKTIQCEEWVKALLSDGEWHLREDAIEQAKAAGLNAGKVDALLRNSDSSEVEWARDGGKKKYRLIGETDAQKEGPPSPLRPAP
jgi:hypothetical protein